MQADTQKVEAKELGNILDRFRLIQYTGCNGQEVLDFYKRYNPLKTKDSYFFTREEKDKLQLCQETPTLESQEFILSENQYLICIDGCTGFIVTSSKGILNSICILIKRFSEDFE